jgi:hypothetical protein
MPGIRLHPNYHGYKLDDPRFAKLLELTVGRGLIVQLVAWMEDERHFLLSPSATHVDLKPLADKAAAFPKLKMLIVGSDWTNNAETLRDLLRQKQIYFDGTGARGSSEVRLLVQLATGDRVVLGSGGPLHDVDADEAILREAKLSDSDWKSIPSKNASKLLAKSMR